MAQKIAFAPIAAQISHAAPRQNWLKRLSMMLAVRQSRLDLAQLSPELLRDVGLTHDDVQAEIARPVWDVPQHWRRH